MHLFKKKGWGFIKLGEKLLYSFKTGHGKEEPGVIHVTVAEIQRLAQRLKASRSTPLLTWFLACRIFKSISNLSVCLREQGYEPWESFYLFIYQLKSSEPYSFYKTANTLFCTLLSQRRKTNLNLPPSKDSAALRGVGKLLQIILRLVENSNLLCHWPTMGLCRPCHENSFSE